MGNLNNTQRIIIVTYIILTLLILLFTTLYSLESPAQFLRFGARIIMLLTVLGIDKKYREHKFLIIAFLFTVISDYFFVNLRVWDPGSANREMYGMLSFVAAYLFLIAAFQRNIEFKKKFVITLVPFVIIFSIVLLSLAKYAVGVMFWAAIILGIVLCYTGAITVSSIYSGYFSKIAAWRIATAGTILFLSDMVVDFSIFHPQYKVFLLWKENMIWSTYMLGWTLLLSVAAEENLLMKGSDQDFTVVPHKITG